MLHLYLKAFTKFDIMQVPMICLDPFNAGIKSLHATLPAAISLLGILTFKGLTARRLYKAFDVKG
jgi:hypothetical protein